MWTPSEAAIEATTGSFELEYLLDSTFGYGKYGIYPFSINTIEWAFLCHCEISLLKFVCEIWVFLLPLWKSPRGEHDLKSNANTSVPSLPKDSPSLYSLHHMLTCGTHSVHGAFRTLLTINIPILYSGLSPLREFSFLMPQPQRVSKMI